MIKHVVMWKFLPGKEQEMGRFLDGLRSLYGVIPQIQSQEVGVNCLPDGFDAVLISTFASKEDLDAIKPTPAMWRSPPCARPSVPNGLRWTSRSDRWRRGWTASL